jgi:hypothetical protein
MKTTFYLSYITCFMSAKQASMKADFLYVCMASELYAKMQETKIPGTGRQVLGSGDGKKTV